MSHNTRIYFLTLVLALISVFSFGTAQEARAEVTLLHEFADGAVDGANPSVYSKLLKDGDIFYGMTYAGGDLGLGTIFKTQTNGTGFTILHEFAGGVDDGRSPRGALIKDGDTLYGMTSLGGDLNRGTIFKIQTDGTGYTLLHEFVGGVDEGQSPYGSLIKDGDTLYGMTYGGGDLNFGTIFKIQTDGTGFTLLHEFFAQIFVGGAFYPDGSLIQDGTTLYGMTLYSGINLKGTIFKIQTDGTGFTLLHEFAGGAEGGAEPFGSLIQSGTSLYGMTSKGGNTDVGTIFKIQTDGTGFTLLHEFAGGADDGSTPYGDLTLQGTTLFGATSLGGDTNVGTIFSLQTDGTDFSLFHEFAGGINDGSGPSSLIYDNVTLYGMTNLGGNTNAGTIFSISADSIVPTLTLNAIDSPTTNPVLTGTAIDSGDFTSNIASVEFRLDTVFGNWTPCTTNDGTYDEPNESFTCDLGDPDPGEHTVYVQAEDSAGNRHTIVYDNGTELLHEFAGGADDGKWPYGSLIQDGDAFYGTTALGGDANLGTIFKIQTDGTGFTLLHEFAGGVDDGSSPYGSLIQDGDTLYGMTGGGGDFGFGTIFKIQTDGTGFILLHEFAGASDGKIPWGSLTQSGNTLYGATHQGGNSGVGTIFKIQTDGTGFTLLHTFEGGAEDGANFFYGSLAISDDTLYGATSQGGNSGYGTIFKIQTDGTGFTLLHEFASGENDGYNPYSSVIKDGSTLYGMTLSGGSSNYGTIFKIQTDGTGFTLLYRFGDDIALGNAPYGYLSQSGNTLYGMTQTNDSIFKIQTDGTGFTRLHAFVGGAGDGTNPSYGGNLTFSGTSLYGMTYSGGDADFGTIFALTASGFESTTFTVIEEEEEEDTPPADDSFAPTNSLNTSLEKSNNTFQSVKKDNTYYTQEESPKLKGTKSDAENGTITLYKKTDKGGSKRIKSESINSNGSWSMHLPKEKDGKEHYALRFTNESGNSSTLTKFFTLVSDSKSPTFTPSLPTSQTIKKGQRIEFPAQDNENGSGLDSYKVQLQNNKGLIVRKWRTQSKDNAFYIIPDLLPFGLYTLQVKAYDKVGNTVEKSIHLNYVQYLPTANTVKTETQQTQQTQQEGSVERVETKKEETQENQNQNQSKTESQSQSQSQATPTEPSESSNIPAPSTPSSKWWNPFTW